MIRTKQIRLALGLHHELKNKAHSRKITLAALAEEIIIEYYKANGQPLTYKPPKRKKTLGQIIKKQIKIEQRQINKTLCKKQSFTHVYLQKSKKKLDTL
jgi:hypothetical protein